MEIYLTVITTVLVVTQVIRLVQNQISLRKEFGLVNAQLSQLEIVTDEDLKRQKKVYEMLEELLPMLLEEYHNFEEWDELDTEDDDDEAI